MTSENETSSDNSASRISMLEKSLALVMDLMKKQATAFEHTLQRLDKLEKATNLIAEAAMNTSNEASAARICEGLSNASKIYPKKRSVIFFGRDYLGDNIKYAYLEFCKYAKENDIDCIFMTYHDEQYQQLQAAGLPCLPRNTNKWTPQDVKTVMEAKALVLCNVFFPVAGKDYIQYAMTRGAKTIQMWHGVPMKEIGLEQLLTPPQYSPRLAEVFGASGVFDVFVGGSAATGKDWAARFAFKKYAASGYPRTDVFFRDLSEHDLINVDLASLDAMKSANKDGRPVILYAPTFRDNKLGVWIETSKAEFLARHCKAKGYAFYMNLHPFEQEISDKVKKLYPDVEQIAPHTDIYPVLKYVDVLITDYSSLAVDFLLRDKPMVFYTPDHEEYASKSRGLIKGYEEYMAGDRAYNIDDLLKATDAAVGYLSNPAADAHTKARNSLKQKMFDHNDGFAARRLCDLIAEQLDEP